MPDVSPVSDINAVFTRARRMASGDLDAVERRGLPSGTSRVIAVVLPSRAIGCFACRPPDAMPADQRASIEKMIPSAVPRNIVAIANTAVEHRTSDLTKTVPFLGFLAAFSSIGHSVWMFEGDPAALAAGCHDADVLFVDGALVPHLGHDWTTVARAAMRHGEIYVHDRDTYALKKA